MQVTDFDGLDDGEFIGDEVINAFMYSLDLRDRTLLGRNSFFSDNIPIDILVCQAEP